MPSFDQIKSDERASQELRREVGAALTGPIDPFDCAERLGVTIRWSADEFDGDNSGDDSARDWSGMARALPDGRLLVLLNSNQTPERARVTLLEEVFHHRLGHTTNELSSEGRIGHLRDQEREAYWTATAALLPMREVALRVHQGRLADEIADEFHVSMELVEMRIKTLRLWEVHKCRTEAHAPLP